MNLSPLQVAERPVHAACAAWPPSGEGLERVKPAASSGDNSDDNDTTSFYQTDFADPRSYRNKAIWTSIGNDAADDPFTETQSRGGPQQQSLFIQEYNRLAEKHGMRVLLFDEEDPDRDYLTEQGADTHTGDRRSWFARAFGKPPATATPRRPSRHSVGSRSDKTPKHKRSGSDPSALSHSSKRDATDRLKNESLATLVRICGKSFLYLPSDYATRSLMLPTCLRAAAQHLAQNGLEARGIFRISGSMRVVNELYEYYCADLDNGTDIAATVRSPNLPFHIKAGVHDVASLFKRLLAGLPGGILGQVPLFNALAEIHKTFSDHGGSGETHILARLLALAIGSVPSQHQRELICAVFGLLSLIGHASEVASSQDVEGTLLPNSERMGYGALGIIFGPLLLGDLLEASSTENVDHFRRRSSTSASATAPPLPVTTSPRSKADRRPKSMVSERLPLSSLPMALDKILLANEIAEMVITNWREVVYQMKTMGVMRKESLLQHPQPDTQGQQVQTRSLRPSRSDTFTDDPERVLPPQTPVFYGQRLRKARSASINRTSDTILSTKQPAFGQVSQRPAEMTFEEFAARKKLRTYTSSMSIASETTTYAAPEVQGSADVLHSTQPPASMPSQPTAFVSQPHLAKLTKQRRVSGGLPSLFGDKSSSPEKGAQSIPRRAVPPRRESNAENSQGSGTSPSPWKIHLRPVRPDPSVGGKLKATGSPVKGNAAQPRPPETADARGPNETPQSKTAALISRIMNPRHQTTTYQENMADTGYPQTKDSDMDTKRPIHRGSMDPSPLPEASTPTPKRYWKSRDVQHTPNVDGSKLNDMHTTSGKPLRDAASLTMPYQTEVADSPTPLSEIKNDARGLCRTRSKTMTARTTPLGTCTTARKMRGYHSETMDTNDCEDTKPTATGSTVKAMAALFDNAIWKDLPTTPPAHQTQKPAWLHGTPTSNRERVSHYMVNPCAPKAEGFVTPSVATYHTPRRPGRVPHADGESPTPADTAAKERRQLRLTKSEDRSARIGRVGRLAASERRDLTRSVDRCDVEDASGRKRMAVGATAMAQTDGKGSTTLLHTLSKRDIGSGRKAEDIKATTTVARHAPRERPKQTHEQAHELQRSLQAKTLECQSWKDRAEAAERRVAELELFMQQGMFESKEKLRPWVSCVGSSDTEDGTASESSLTTVVVRNRLANERLIPFMA